VLEAHAIPYFVHNGGFGGLYPGMQIDLFNVRTIMVPRSAAGEARDVLQHFLHGDDGAIASNAGATHRLSGWDRIRLIAELLMFGWCVPPVAGRRF
jgi:hypothetical protein